MAHRDAAVISKVRELLQAGRTQREVARLTGVPQTTISRWARGGRAKDEDGERKPVDTERSTPPADHTPERNGHLPATTASQSTAMPSQPSAAHPVAVHRSEQTPWVSRGLQMAAEMAEAVDAYARQHRLEKREVLDLALRTFFAQVGEGVRGDA
jgi:transposase-like protein